MRKSILTHFPRFPPAAVYLLGSCPGGSQLFGGSRGDNTYTKEYRCCLSSKYTLVQDTIQIITVKRRAMVLLSWKGLLGIS